MTKGQEPIVLMADDDDDDCMLARDAFEESKARGTLSCVEDGSMLMEYLSRAAKHTGQDCLRLPALILLDLNMPKMTGREALAAIKSIPALVHIPIVVLTTSQEADDIAYCLKMGAKFFITKPHSFDEWVEMMGSLANECLN